MAAPKGNKHATGNAGKGKSIETPEMMWKLFTEYKTWCKANPRVENVVIQREMVTIERKLERPLTWNGFDTWLCDNGIIQDTEHYRANLNGAYVEYLGVISRIRKAMDTDKFEGATVGIYNANIIARDLGLVEKTQNDHTTKGEKIHGGEYDSLSVEEKRQLLELMKKANTDVNTPS